MDFSDRSVTIWSDYLCPFCWVARPRASWLASLGVPVDWQPFELHAEIPRAGISRELLRDAVRSGRGAQVRSLAEDEQVELAYPSFVPNTRLAHEAGEWARARGDAEHVLLHDAIFEAYWSGGRDIGRLDVLAEIADETGLDGAALRTSVESGSHYGEVEKTRDRARDHGVSGTPAFLVARADTEFLIPGLQSEAFFRRVIERIGSG